MAIHIKIIDMLLIVFIINSYYYYIIVLSTAVVRTVQSQHGYAAATATSNQPQNHRISYTAASTSAAPRGQPVPVSWAISAPRSHPVPVNGRAREVWSQAYDSTGRTYCYIPNTGVSTWSRHPGAVSTMASQ